MTLTEIRLALRAPLLASPDFPGENLVQWENKNFKPPEDGRLWIREHLIAPSRQYLASGQAHWLGIYWLFVHAPVGTGTGEAEALVASLIQAYGMKSLDGFHLYKVEPGQPRIDSPGGHPWYTIPVLVYWRAFEEVTP